MTEGVPVTKAEMRSRGFEIIKAKSFVRKRITLASGQESDHYFDMKPSMLDPEGALVFAELILDLIEGQGGGVDYVGGLEMGAVPLVGPVAMRSLERTKALGHAIPGMFVRKAVKAHGTQRLIEGVEDVAGKRIVIVEDVTTTGGSALKAIKALQEAGAEIVFVVSLVDRQQGAADAFAAEGIAFRWLYQAGEFLRAA